jgi:nicotinamide-nucleotide amidase
MSTASRLYKGDKTTRRVSEVEPAPRVQPDKEGAGLAGIVSIGTELVRGRLQDSNAAWLAENLSRRGCKIDRIQVVPDEDAAITSVLKDFLTRGCSLIVTSGGLGPTADDRTLGATADALGLPLAIHPEAKEMVEASYKRLKERKIVSHDGLTRSREKMCAIPLGGKPLLNEDGIAPGALTRLPTGSTVVNLPGLPEQMQATWTEALTHIRELQAELVTARREVQAPTLDESVLQPWLDTVQSEFPQVWIKTYAPGFRKKRQGIRVTFEADAGSKHEAELKVEGALRRLLTLAGAG